MKITIPGMLPSLNEIIDAAKAHHMKYANIKKQTTRSCSLIAQQLPKNLDKIYLDITYYVPDWRTDLDNRSVAKKFIFDGLVEAGVIQDDTHRYVAGWNEEFKKDKHNPRIEVEVKEVGETE